MKKTRTIIAAMVLALALALPHGAARGEMLVSEWTDNKILRVDKHHFRDMVTMAVVHELNKDLLVNMKTNTFYKRKEPGLFIDQRTGEPWRVEY